MDDLRSSGEIKDVTITFGTNSKQYILNDMHIHFKLRYVYTKIVVTFVLLNRSPAPTHVSYV